MAKDLAKEEDSSQLTEQIVRLIENAKQHVAAQVNSAMVCTYYEIGRMIVEHEQQGKIRAKYGTKIIPELAKRLTARLGKGFSKSNLANMRQFYIVYSKRFIDSNDGASIFQTASGKFLLSWSHYLFLMGISNPQERLFYEQEAVNERWSLRELKRQFNSALYERLALSRDKNEVSELSQQGLIVESPADIVKDPYVLEFLGLPENSSYSESKLEECIIDELQNFLMELGKGYTFVGRQVRLTFDEQHFYVDLVFFNRLLQCFVLIDLKIGDITHQDIGQMQMYVNYYDRKIKLSTENPTVGILLCKKKNDALVEMTLPKDNSQIFASKYELVLPNKEELMRLLEEKFSEE